MLPDVDLTCKMCDPPLTNWCASGHKAPELFRNGGPGSPEEPTRFFHVTGKDINMIVCEPCMIIANHVARLKKQGVI